MKDYRLYKSRFIPSIAIIAIILIATCLNLETLQKVVSSMYTSCAGSLGWFFILVDIACLAMTFWFIFGPHKHDKLGGPEAKTKYSNFSWMAMMFTTCVSAGLSVFCFIEPIIYSSSSVPMHGDPLTIETFEKAQMYAHFHWGFNAWCLYVPITIAIGYAVYNKKKKEMTVSTACSNVLGKSKFLGCSLDVCSLVGGMMAPVVSMGLGMPVITALLKSLFNLNDSYDVPIQITVLIIWVIMFCTSLYRGLDKGIKVLSNINTITFFVFLGFIALAAGLPFIFKSELNALGLYASEFLRMTTYTDPYGDGAFLSDWTIFYWAWFMVYIPLMGVFNAKISEGRSYRAIALGQMVGSSLGSWIAMAIAGNYSLKLQMTGKLDVASILAEQGKPGAIVAVLSTLPCAKIMIAIMIIMIFLFMATTVDSSSLVAAESTIIHHKPNSMAPRHMRLLWAGVTCITTAVLLVVGGFSAVQTLAVVAGLPVAIVTFVIIISLLKTLRNEKK